MKTLTPHAGQWGSTLGEARSRTTHVGALSAAVEACSLTLLSPFWTFSILCLPGASKGQVPLQRLRPAASGDKGLVDNEVRTARGL